jgi:hypothetical protein
LIWAVTCYTKEISKRYADQNYNGGNDDRDYHTLIVPSIMSLSTTAIIKDLFGSGTSAHGTADDLRVVYPKFGASVS